MAQVKLALRDLTDSELSNFVAAHIAAMTGNANFTTPRPSAVDFAALATSFDTNLSAQTAALAAAKEATAQKDAARGALETAFTTRANYINEVSAGDAATILSSGLPTRAAAAPIGLPAAPGNVMATMGDLSGSIDVMWDPVRGAKSFIVQMTTTPTTDGSWAQVKLATSSSCTVDGLTSGTRYYFRVAALGTAGQGAWSDLVEKMAG